MKWIKILNNDQLMFPSQNFLYIFLIEFIFQFVK